MAHQRGAALPEVKRSELGRATAQGLRGLELPASAVVLQAHASGQGLHACYSAQKKNQWLTKLPDSAPTVPTENDFAKGGMWHNQKWLFSTSARRNIHQPPLRMSSDIGLEQQRHNQTLVLLDFGVAEYGVRDASDWTTDSVRDGVVGEQRLNKHCCIGELRLIRVFIGIAPGNLTGELLSWKEIIGSGAEVGERYAHGTNWHLAVSEQSFGLN